MAALMNIYSFEISQLPDDAIRWVAGECKNQLDSSPIFFGAVGNACLDEIERRRINPDGPPTELQIPWIADNVEHYIAACQLVTLAMLAAHEGQNYLLRNFF